MRVELSDVGHGYDAGPPLFAHLSAELLPGRTYALTGPSGAGKSTLLAILAEMLRPRSGTVRRDDVREVRWVFQNPFGVARRSVLDHVVHACLLRGQRRADAEPWALELLADFGLRDRAHHRFAALSGGEAQRLMLARAVAGAPDLLLVDEPTAQLDAVTADVVNRSLEQVAGRGAIVVIATHDPRTRDHCSDLIDLTAHLGAAGAGTGTGTTGPG
ncbi:MAG TPA: ATP-binding cassette domain-containing protein [Cellulomonas sp.]